MIIIGVDQNRVGMRAEQGTNVNAVQDQTLNL